MADEFDTPEGGEMASADNVVALNVALPLQRQRSEPMSIDPTDDMPQVWRGIRLSIDPGAPDLDLDAAIRILSPSATADEPDESG